MYLYNVGMGIWRYLYTFHITNFAKVSSGEMGLHGQKVLGIMCAHGLCLVLSSFSILFHRTLLHSKDCKQEKVIGFFLL